MLNEFDLGEAGGETPTSSISAVGDPVGVINTVVLWILMGLVWESFSVSVLGRTRWIFEALNCSQTLPINEHPTCFSCLNWGLPGMVLDGFNKYLSNGAPKPAPAARLQQPALQRRLHGARAMMLQVRSPAVPMAWMGSPPTVFLVQ